jgi:hypothetical protein
MVVDTFLRTLSIPPDKEAKLAAFLEDFFDRREATLSELASLRGRVQHYSACLPYVAPFVALFSSVIGTEADPDYDRTVSVPPAICEAALFIRGVLSDYAIRGRPLWPLVPSTLFAAFLAGETGPARVVTITWDASLHGWGMVLRWWDNRAGKVIIRPLPDTEHMSHQVRREPLAGTSRQPHSKSTCRTPWSCSATTQSAPSRHFVKEASRPLFCSSAPCAPAASSAASAATRCTCMRPDAPSWTRVSTTSPAPAPSTSLAQSALLSSGSTCDAWPRPSAGPSPSMPSPPSPKTAGQRRCPAVFCSLRRATR